jgi:hypothetical protein
MIQTNSAAATRQSCRTCVCPTVAVLSWRDEMPASAGIGQVACRHQKQKSLLFFIAGFSYIAWGG